MKEKKNGLILALFLLLLINFFALAQNNFGSEKELRKQAENLFKDDEFAAALPLYSQLLSLYPKDPNFNYKYGVCLLYAKENKEKPLPYLTFAVGKDEVDDDIYYHLGKAYHLNYRFDEAIAQYNIFKQKKSKTSTKLEVDLQIRQCENGKSLLRNVTDLTVVEKKELNSTEYFRAYDLNKIGAKLVVKPDDLKTPFDVKKKDQSTVVIRQTSQEIYYSSYGADGKNGRDIYKISKLPNFTWGQPVNLGPSINTQYDEDFPYITPDGKTLYFCSKGHNSMGGYDVFKSELNPSGEWNKPQNLDFAVNTPDDDIQYVTDPESDFAYFSSKRNSADGRIVVFKVKTERVPVTAAIIKGKVLSDALPVNLAAKISIKNVQTGKFIGTFNSSDRDGKYRLNLNNGTKYEFTVEQSGTPPITQFVEIPPLKELRPLRQEIQLKKKDGATTMVIYNFFSDTVENNALATAELFKERANLDVNYDEQIQAGIISEASNKTVADNKVLSNRNAYQENITQSSPDKEKQANSANTQTENKETAKVDNKQGNNQNNSSTNTTSADTKVASNTKATGINNSEIVTIAKEDAKETQKEADDTRDKSRQAYAFANLKNNAAQKKYKEASDAESQANAITNLEEKQLQFDVASKAKKDGDVLSQQAVVAYNLAKDLETEADAKQAEANMAEQYANDLELAVKSNSTEALEKLEKQSKELEKNQNTTKSNNPDILVKQSQEKSAEASRLEERKNDLKAEIQESMFDEKIAREEILKAKNDSVKDANENKLKEVLAARTQKQKELEGIDGKVAKLKEESIALEEEAKINKEILNEIAGENTSNLPELAKEDKQKLDAQFSGQKNVAANETKSEQVAKVNDNKSNNSTSQNGIVPNQKIENYSDYIASTDENKKEALLIQYQQVTAKADSTAKLLNNATEPNEIKSISELQKSYTELATSKKLAANIIAYNIYNKEYDANQNALNQKLQGLPEVDKENFKNSLNQIEGDYKKAIDSKDNALLLPNLQEKESGVNTAVNAQNVVLVRQRKLLEQANSSIANNNVENKATASFKGFNTDRNSTATEAVNSLRPDYTNYSTPLKLKPQEADSIKRTTEFLQFVGIVEKAKSLEDAADKKAKEYTNTKAQGEEKVIESQQLIDLASEEKKKSKKQALAEEAIRVDNEGKDLLIKADTLKMQAQNDMLKSAAIKAEADKFMAKLNKSQQDKIVAVYQNQIIIPDETIASSAETTNNSEIEKNTAKEANKSNVASNNNIQKQEANNKSTKSEPSKQSETKVETAVNENSSTTQETKKEVAVVAKTKDKESVLKEIKASPEYIAYASIKNEVETLKVEASQKRAEADTMKIQAQRDAMNSNDLFEFAAAQPKKKDRKAAQLKAEEMDRVARENQIKADSLNTLAEKSETAARMKQYEADNYLRKFDEVKSKTLLMAYNNAVPEELLKADEPVSTPVASNNKVPNSNKNASETSNKQSEQTAGNNSKTQNILNQNKVAENSNKQNEIAQNNKLENKTNLANENKVEQNTIEPVVLSKPPKPDVKTTPEYNNYINLKNEAEQAQVEATTWKARVDSTRALSAQKLEESNNKLEEAASLKKRKRKPLVKEAAELDYESQLQARSADSLNVFANQANKKANDKKAAAEGYLSSIDKELSLRIMRSIQGIPEPVEVETAVASSENNANSNASNERNQSITLGINNNKPHSTTNKIKMNEPLPDGLIFKVQIGAFNKPVADNSFGSVSPVTAETLPNSNLIRYTAGLFRAFDEAANARKELNKLNYKDAFVVAYCYGKRMSVTEARALIASGKDCKNGGATSYNQNTIASNNSNNLNTRTSVSSNASNNTTNVTENANVNSTLQIKQGETLPQQDIQVIKGLLYTVQVGVYSKPVKAGQLYNITPLYYELNQKGQYRYTSGVYNDVREATKAKDVIVQIGVSDAFVSAYINGKRIPMEQAAAMEAQQGKSIFAQIPGMNVQPKTIAVSNSIEQKASIPQETKIVNPPLNNTPTNIVYKVQLGAFRNEVPVEIMNKYLTIADKGIANFKSGDLTIYTVGNFKDAASAEIVKVEVISKGINDAFVIALNNGEKISLDEAKKLGGK
ncbi:MAG TPA: hypothetical protein PK323_03570 [Bacteroidia bacterium]|nr:hypothetical protein [Bacteroidia bacterium]